MSLTHTDVKSQAIVADVKFDEKPSTKLVTKLKPPTHKTYPSVITLKQLSVGHKYVSHKLSVVTKPNKKEKVRTKPFVCKEMADIHEAEKEALCGEILRFLIRRHPKIRTWLLGDSKEAFVGVEEIKEFKDFVTLFTEALKTPSKKHTLTQEMWEDLAEILVVCLFLIEFDLAPQNVGVDGNGRIYKIDQGHCLASLMSLYKEERFSHLSAKFTKDNLKKLANRNGYGRMWLSQWPKGHQDCFFDKAYDMLGAPSALRVINRMILKISLLPNQFFAEMTESYVSDPQRREAYRKLLISSRDMMCAAGLQDVNFCKYLMADASREDLVAYELEAKSFETMSHYVLWDGMPEASQVMKRKFNGLMSLMLIEFAGAKQLDQAIAIATGLFIEGNIPCLSDEKPQPLVYSLVEKAVDLSVIRAFCEAKSVPDLSESEEEKKSVISVAITSRTNSFKNEYYNSVISYFLENPALISQFTLLQVCHALDRLIYNKMWDQVKLLIKNHRKINSLVTLPDGKNQVDSREVELFKKVVNAKYCVELCLHQVMSRLNKDNKDDDAAYNNNLNYFLHESLYRDEDKQLASQFGRSHFRVILKIVLLTNTLLDELLKDYVFFDKDTRQALQARRTEILRKSRDNIPEFCNYLRGPECQTDLAAYRAELSAMLVSVDVSTELMSRFNYLLSNSLMLYVDQCLMRDKASPEALRIIRSDCHFDANNLYFYEGQQYSFVGKLVKNKVSLAVIRGVCEEAKRPADLVRRGYELPLVLAIDNFCQDEKYYASVINYFLETPALIRQPYSPWQLGVTLFALISERLWEQAKLLIKVRPDVDLTCSNSQGHTLLHHLATSEKCDMTLAKALCESKQGVDVFARERTDMRTAASFSILNSNYALTDYLLNDEFISKYSKDDLARIGLYFLLRASVSKHELDCKHAEDFLRRYPEIHLFHSTNGSTALHSAVTSRSLVLVSLLCEAQREVWFALGDASNHTAFDIAVNNNSIDIILYFLNQPDLMAKLSQIQLTDLLCKLLALEDSAPAFLFLKNHPNFDLNGEGSLHRPIFHLVTNQKVDLNLVKSFCADEKRINLSLPAKDGWGAIAFVAEYSCVEVAQYFVNNRALLSQCAMTDIEYAMSVFLGNAANFQYVQPLMRNRPDFDLVLFLSEYLKKKLMIAPVSLEFFDQLPEFRDKVTLSILAGYLQLPLLKHRIVNYSHRYSVYQVNQAIGHLLSEGWEKMIGKKAEADEAEKAQHKLDLVPLAFANNRRSVEREDNFISLLKKIIDAAVSPREVVSLVDVMEQEERNHPVFNMNTGCHSLLSDSWKGAYAAPAWMLLMQYAKQKIVSLARAEGVFRREDVVLDFLRTPTVKFGTWFGSVPPEASACLLLPGPAVAPPAQAVQMVEFKRDY